MDMDDSRDFTISLDSMLMSLRCLWLLCSRGVLDDSDTSGVKYLPGVGLLGVDMYPAVEMSLVVLGGVAGITSTMMEGISVVKSEFRRE
jgi:hypothetical protein